jgi:hypothetical protein
MPSKKSVAGKKKTHEYATAPWGYDLTRGTKKSSGVGAIYGYFKPATASSTPATTAASDSEVDGQQHGVTFYIVTDTITGWFHVSL